MPVGTVVFVVLSYLVSIVMIRSIYPADYLGSLSFLPWVMLAQMFQGGYLMFVCFSHYTFRTKPLGVITFTWSLIACVLAWAGIRLFGPVGVSMASAFVSFAIFVSVTLLAVRVYPMPWRHLFSFKL